MCLKRRNKMSEPSTPRGRKRSRASPPRTYFTIISLFASFIYCSFSFFIQMFTNAILNTTICRSVLHTRLLNYLIEVRPNFIHKFAKTNFPRIIVNFSVHGCKENYLHTTECCMFKKTRGERRLKYIACFST